MAKGVRLLPEEIEVEKILDEAIQKIAELKKIGEQIPKDKGLDYHLRPQGSSLFGSIQNNWKRESNSKQIDEIIGNVKPALDKITHQSTPQLKEKIAEKYEHWKRPEIIDREVIIVNKKEPKDLSKSQDVAKGILDKERETKAGFLKDQNTLTEKGLNGSEVELTDPNSAGGRDINGPIEDGLDKDNFEPDFDR